MSVTTDDIKKVSHLARIMVDDQQAEVLQESLNRVLHFVEQLNDIDCSALDDSIQYASSLHEREDVVEDCDRAVMDNATQKERNMFVVPKMVG